MKYLEQLYKNRNIRFRHLLFSSYLKLRLSESECVLLYLLYEQETAGNNELSLSDLANRTTFGVDELAEKVDVFVKKNYISLDYVETAGKVTETYSVLPTLVKILDFSFDVTVDKAEVVKMLEQEIKKPLSSKEVMIVESWNYTFEEIKEALLIALKQQKVTVPYINKVLENKAEEVVKDMSYFDKFLDE